MGYSEKGSDELAAALRLIGERMYKAGAMRAVRKGAAKILEAQIQHTDIFKGTKLGPTSLDPGELKESLKIRTSFADGVAKAKIGPGNTRTRKAGYLVEFGHRIVTGGKSRLGAKGQYIGPGKANATKDVPPEAFIRPAFEESEWAAEQAMAEQAMQEIEKGNL